MRIFIISALLIVVFSLSCVKKLCGCDPYVPAFYRAVVVETNNMDCSKPLVRIEIADTDQLNNSTGAHGDLYVVNQLPSAYLVNRKKIYISVASFAAGEDFVCGTSGPAYPHLKVVNAAERN